MSNKWNVETVLKEIRHQDRKSPVIVRKNGHQVFSTTDDYVPGPITLQPVSSYHEEVKYFLIFFRKRRWVIELQ